MILFIFADNLNNLNHFYIMKKFTFLLFILFFVSCDSNSISTKKASQKNLSESEIEMTDSISALDMLWQTVVDYNKTMPQQIDMRIKSINAELDQDNKLYVYNYVDLESEGGDVLQNKKGFEARRLPQLRSLVNDDMNRHFLDVLVEAGYGMKFVYKGARTKHEIVTIITLEEITKILKDYYNQESNKQNTE